MSATIDADGGSQLLYAGSDQYLAVNLDTAVTVYISQSRTVYTSDIPLPPQASVQLSGPWYVSTCDHGTVAQIAILPGSAGGYSNPVGVQIALATLGLAKDTSVQAVHTALGSPAQDASVQAVHTALGSPAQDASVQAVHTALGSPAQDASVTGISGQSGWQTSGLSTEDTLFNRLTLIPNGQFKQGSLAGWSESHCTAVSVTTQPAGAPRKWAALITPSGSSTFWEFEGNWIPVTASQVLNIRCFLYAVAISVGQIYQLAMNWKDASGNQLSQTVINQNVIPGLWLHISASFTAPAGAAFGQLIIAAGGSPTGNIPVTDTAYVEDITGHSNTPGMFAQDLSLQALHAPGKTIAQEIQSGVEVAAVFNQPIGNSPVSIFTFPTAGRIWGVWIAFGYSAGASYTPGANFPYAEINSSGVGGLLASVLAMQAPSTSDAISEVVMFPNPLPVNSGDAETLIINGGAAISGATLHASAGVYYSVP